jgi:hypothetical protein
MLNDGSGTCLVSVDHVISYEDQKANMFADVYVKVGSDSNLLKVFLNERETYKK